jgi:hypothetical protein
LRSGGVQSSDSGGVLLSSQLGSTKSSPSYDVLSLESGNIPSAKNKVRSRPSLRVTVCPLCPARDFKKRDELRRHFLRRHSEHHLPGKEQLCV